MTPQFPAPGSAHIPTNDQAAKYLEEARSLASAGLVVSMMRLTELISDGNPVNPLTPKQVMDMGEHFYKVSGMAAKQAAAAQSNGPAFSITINIPGQDALTITPSASPIFDALPERAPDRPPLFVVTEDLTGDE